MTPINKNYSATKSGKIFSHRAKRFLKPFQDSDGYNCVDLGAGNRVWVAKLIAKTFIGPRPRGKQVDHKNTIRCDDRLSNLRYATPSQNGRNGKKRKGTSRYKGVYRVKNGWMAYIWFSGKQHYLGTYRTQLAGAKAYDVAAREHFGKFARINLP